MRCPRCEANNLRQELYCGRCHHRLFAWLGDPFGQRDLPSAARAAPSLGRDQAREDQARTTLAQEPWANDTRQRQCVPWGKIFVAVLALWIVAPYSPGGAALAAVVIGLALLQSPEMSWLPFLGVVVGVLWIALQAAAAF